MAGAVGGHGVVGHAGEQVETRRVVGAAGKAGVECQ